MKIGRCTWQGKPRLALVDEQANEVLLVDADAKLSANPVLDVIQRRIALAQLRGGTRVPLHGLVFLPPLSALVRNVLAVGKNYRDHALEFDKSGFNATGSAASPIPAFPQVFTKATTAQAGPTDPIRFDPAQTESVDYEGEIGVVIGEECRNVSRSDAMSKVFGFVLVNDVTARDLQKNHAQWFLGKSLDTFCPVGPWIATKDEVPMESLRLSTWVNGELRQEASIAQLIFDIPTLVETISRGTTLLAGDIIATGTPVGVGIGFSPPKFLRDGDVVRVAAPGLGEMNNRVETTR